DPHRPFAGSRGEEAQEQKRGRQFPAPAQVYRPEEVTVPGFLPDIPGVREEMSHYYTSARRCDETLGAVIRALDEAGVSEDTCVTFLSDNGISQPFAKTNCYLSSTRTPWLVRWPGQVPMGVVDHEHMISGIDYASTVLEAANLEPMQGVDGHSFLPVLRGKSQQGRDLLLTCMNQTSAKRDYPMRCLMTRRFGYIFNAWSDGKTEFQNEPCGGMAFAAMREAAETDEAIAARVRFFKLRVPEEFYDFQKDPCALNNLIDEPALSEEISTLRRRLHQIMRTTQDPLADIFETRVVFGNR
ncbi:MAG TPA: sulfatase-like hydrolase/transferase, partial [bacterium]|nr:sulfatase-like hydrolase/transferase [bacterium]